MTADVSQFTGEVHPYAAVFPMLPDADLDALADDIAANGLLNPITLDQDGVLIDGRNRLEACTRAGVTPEFRTVFLLDRVGFIVGQNMQRRDLTQAQKAHLVVAAGSNLEQRELAAVAGVPRARIGEAVIVARFTPAASTAVIAGTLTHQKAYEQAKGIKDDLAAVAAQRAELEANAPDLLTLVHDEAWAAYRKRTEQARERAEAMERNRLEASLGLVNAVTFLGNRSRGDYIPQLIGEYRPDDAPESMRLTADWLDHAIRTLTTIREGY